MIIKTTKQNKKTQKNKTNKQKKERQHKKNREQLNFQNCLYPRIHGYIGHAAFSNQPCTKISKNWKLQKLQQCQSPLGVSYETT